MHEYGTHIEKNDVLSSGKRASVGTGMTAVAKEVMAANLKIIDIKPAINGREKNEAQDWKRSRVLGKVSGNLWNQSTVYAKNKGFGSDAICYIRTDHIEIESHTCVISIYIYRSWILQLHNMKTMVLILKKHINVLNID